MSAAVMPAHEAALAHHHHAMRVHHAANVARAHSGHHGAMPETTTGFSVVAQFSNADFSATTAVADNDIWAVGDTNDGTSNQAPLAVHFNGTSWSAVPTQNTHGNLQAIAAISANDIWAVGDAGIFHWNGTSWSLVSAVPSGVSDPDGVAALSDGTVVVVSGSGAIVEN